MAAGYEHAFNEALSRTDGLGLPVPQVPFSSSRFLSDAVLYAMGHNIRQWFPNMRAEDLVGQCLTVHANLRNKVEELLKVSAYLNIGDVSISGERAFGVDDAYLDHLWHNKITPKEVVKLHAWLTLPSMEIIDVTLAATFLALSGKPLERHGNFVAAGAIASHADELKDGLVYHPCLVGHDYLQKIGALAYINPDEAEIDNWLERTADTEGWE